VCKGGEAGGLLRGEWHVQTSADWGSLVCWEGAGIGDVLTMQTQSIGVCLFVSLG
jgi:hypothetical protein